MGWDPLVPWSQVFNHEVTFAAPALFAEAMPQIDPSKVRDAVLAHALAVIDAFGTDRIEDRQIEAFPELEEVLEFVRRASRNALVRVVGALGDETREFDGARRAMLTAISAERQIMAEGTRVPYDLYEKIALGKAGMGLPASIALAKAAGWNRQECLTVRRTLDAVWLAMQCYDDVVDWEDDLRRDSSWVVHLLALERNDAIDLASGHEMVRSGVLDSGILAEMLERSARHFRAARKRADALGARELAAWAGNKEMNSRMLSEHERRSSGYAVRLHALSPWVAQVLS
jgi:hypothetical protein